MLPFFSTAHLYCKLTGRFGANGYTTPYFIANGVAGMCWLYLCMFFFWQVLTALKISELVKTLSSVILLFGSNAIFFSVDAPSYSHIFSFGLITIFIWATFRFHQSGSYRFLYLMAFFIGWIFITRPVNITASSYLFPFCLELNSAPWYKNCCKSHTACWSSCMWLGAAHTSVFPI